MAVGENEQEMCLDFSRVPFVDLKYLSQDEINAAAHNLDASKFDDIIIPKIDPSLFQESNASKKQTYSKARSSRKREGLDTVAGYRAGHFLVPRPKTVADASGKEDAQRILELIQRHLKQSDQSAKNISMPNSSLSNPVSNAENACPMDNVATTTQESCQLVTTDSTMQNGESNVLSGAPDNINVTTASNTIVEKSKKKIRTKEGARRKAFMNLNNSLAEQSSVKPPDLKTDNKACSPEAANESCGHMKDNTEQTKSNIAREDSGIPGGASVVTAEALIPQFKRRFTTESELQEFFSSIGGEWASKLKKRKIVNARDYVQGLPHGWKILLGVRKKNGRFIIECRKYISPDGLQFASCKEVSAHLSNSSATHSGGVAVQDNLHKVHLSLQQESVALNEATSKGLGNSTDASAKNSPNACSSVMLDLGKRKWEMPLEKTDSAVGTKRRYNPNSLNTPMHCKKCNITYSNRSTFMAHLTIHHIKRKKMMDDSGNSRHDNNDVFVGGANKMDGSSVPLDDTNNVSTVIMQVDEGKNADKALVNEDKANNVDNVIVQSENVIDCADKDSNAISSSNGNVLNLSNSMLSEKDRLEYHPYHEKIGGKDQNHDDTTVASRENLKGEAAEQSPAVLDADINKADRALNLEDTPGICPSEEHPISSNPFLDLLQETTGDNSLASSNLGQQNFDGTSTNGHVPEFENVQKYMPSPKISFDALQDGNSSVCAASGIRLDEVELLPDQFGWDSLLPEREPASSQFIVCIWCNTEFSNDGIDQEQQSDSVGFICPHCKTKISGQVEETTDIEKYDD